MGFFEYHRLSQPQLAWGKKVLERLRLRGDELLLDPGCGTGRLTELLLKLVPQGRVVALDLSLNMLTAAREHLKPRFQRRVSFVAADLQQLPCEHRFEGIVSTAAFHWVLDHSACFAACTMRCDQAGGFKHNVVVAPIWRNCGNA